MLESSARSRSRWVIFATFALATAVLFWVVVGALRPAATTARASAASAAPAAPAAPAASAASLLQLTHRLSVFEAAYYRPVTVDGMAFPVLRSNFLSLMDFENSWHALRMRFIDGKWRLVGRHEGVDITAERGTPVVSMTDGVVEAAGWTFYSGTRVGVRGTDGRYYLYAHLDSLSPGIGPGARVAAGTILGLVGNTGYGDPGHRDEFPAHLHFGIEGPEGWVNPYPTLLTLYRATVNAQRRSETQLRRLAERGDREGWQDLADQLFMHPPLLDGE